MRHQIPLPGWISVLLVFLFPIGCLAAELSPGAFYEGKAVSDHSGRTWPVKLKVVAVDASGAFRGELDWTSLGSLHEIRGTSAGLTLTFREVAAIKRGGAHLNCEYALIVDRNLLRGRWIEPGADEGTIELAATGLPPPRSEIVQPPAFSSGMVFEGSVVSTRSGRSYQATIEIAAIDPSTGVFQGAITWPSLNAVNRIDGRISQHTISFKETQYIKQGGAHLNCEYELVLDGASLRGPWREPGNDEGTVALTRR